MFLAVATFKSNKTKKEVESWLEQVALVASEARAEVVVAPSTPYLDVAHAKISHLKSPILLASQDVSPFPPGSYTGAVNAVQLKDMGVQYCIVGHSERRRYFHETHTEIANKVSELLSSGITPIVCLAEDDIFPQLSALTDEMKSQVVYCFEPPANIGGTEIGSVDEIKRVVELIRTSVGEARVMYGGSVNAGNISSLLTLSIDGVLVSSASLDPGSFSDIIKVYGHSEKK